MVVPVATASRAFPIDVPEARATAAASPRLGERLATPKPPSFDDAAVGVDQRARLGTSELVGPEPGVRPLDQREGIPDVLLDGGGLELIEGRSHPFIMTRGCDRNGPAQALYSSKRSGRSAPIA